MLQNKQEVNWNPNEPFTTMAENRTSMCACIYIYSIYIYIIFFNHTHSVCPSALASMEKLRFQLSWIKFHSVFSILLYTHHGAKKRQVENYSFKGCSLHLQQFLFVNHPQNAHKSSPEACNLALLIRHLSESGPYSDTTKTGSIACVFKITRRDWRLC